MFWSFGSFACVVGRVVPDISEDRRPSKCRHLLVQRNTITHFRNTCTSTSYLPWKFVYQVWCLCGVEDSPCVVVQYDLIQPGTCLKTFQKNIRCQSPKNLILWWCRQHIHPSSRLHGVESKYSYMYRPIEGYYFIWQIASPFTQTVSRNGWRSSHRYSSLLCLSSTRFSSACSSYEGIIFLRFSSNNHVPHLTWKYYGEIENSTLRRLCWKVLGLFL